MNPKIIEFVKKELASGKERSEIYAQLSELGLTHDEILEAFRGGDPQIVPQEETQKELDDKKPKPPKAPMNKKPLIVLILIIAVAGGGYYAVQTGQLDLNEVMSQLQSTTSSTTSTTSSTTSTTAVETTTTVLVTTTSSTSTTTTSTIDYLQACREVCATKGRVGMCISGKSFCTRKGGFQGRTKINECPMSKQSCCCLEPEVAATIVPEIVTTTTIEGVDEVSTTTLPKRDVTVSGFSKLTPTPSSIRMSSDGVFESTFINSVGTTIILRDITILFKDQILCRSSLRDSQVFAGEDFPVEVRGCDVPESASGLQLTVRIGYGAKLGASTTEHQESGFVGV